MKRVAIVQSNYVPWRGYFDLISSVDEFILLDDVQYTKQDWRNRNRIKTENGVVWLTIPVHGGLHKRIDQVEIANPGWASRHLATLTHAYRSAPGLERCLPWLTELYMEADSSMLSEVNRAFLEMLMEKDYLPVIAPVGIGPEGETLHLSPEGAAAEVAIALGAPKLILLQDAKGLVSGGEVRNQLTVNDLEHQLADGAVPPKTKPLVHAILRALAGGVERVHVLDGRLAHATIAELFTDDGVGTLVTAG